MNTAQVRYHKIKVVFCILILAVACDSESPHEYLDEGKSLFFRGELESARVQFQNVLQTDPEQSDAYYYLALIDQKKKDWGGMITHLLDAVAVGPGNIEARNMLGKIYFLGGQYDKAEEQVDIVRHWDPENTVANLLRASVFYQRGHQREAMSVVEDVLKKQPHRAEALALKAKILVDQGLQNEADSVLQAAIEKNPQDLDLQYLSITFAIEQNHFLKAEKAYQILISRYPQDIRFPVALSELLIQTGRQDDAEKILRAAVKHMPEQTALKLNLIRLIESRDSERAEELIQNFIVTSRDNSALRFHLVENYIRRRLFSEARNELRYMIDLAGTGDVLRAKIKLAEIALLQQNLSEVHRLTSGVLREDALNTDMLMLRAAMNLKKRNADEAISDLRIVLRDRPNFEQALMFLAQAHLLRGDKASALKQWWRILNINPGNLAAIMPLTHHFIKRGEYNRAEHLLNKGMENPHRETALIELLIQVRVAKRDWRGAKQAVLRLKNSSEQQKNYWQGVIETRQGHVESAIRFYQAVLTETPGHRLSLQNLAQLYESAGKQDELIRYLESLLNKTSDSHALNQFVAEVFAGNRQWREAEKLLRVNIDQNGKDPQDFMTLARVYQKQGRLEEAEQTFLNGLENTGHNLKLMTGLAKFYIGKKAFLQSIEWYQKIIKADPSQDEAANNLADLLVTFQSETPASVDLALALVKRFENTPNPSLQDTYGWVHLKAGNVKRALSVLKKSSASSPPDARHLYHLSEAYLKNGDQKQALEALRKSLDLAKTQGEFIEINRAVERFSLFQNN